MMFVGSLCAIINGAALPSMIIVFGEMIDTFVDTGKLTLFLDSIAAFLTSEGLTKEEIVADVTKLNNP